MSIYFISTLDTLRAQCGFPLKVNSGYRSTKHSIEQAKAKPGMHTTGKAADLAVNGGVQKYLLVQCAMNLGFTGIGIGDNFIHVDKRLGTPVMWTY